MTLSYCFGGHVSSPVGLVALADLTSCLMICKDMPNSSDPIRIINPLAVYDVNTIGVQSSQVRLKTVIYCKFVRICCTSCELLRKLW